MIDGDGESFCIGALSGSHPLSRRDSERCSSLCWTPKASRTVTRHSMPTPVASIQKADGVSVLESSGRWQGPTRSTVSSARLRRRWADRLQDRDGLLPFQNQHLQACCCEAEILRRVAFELGDADSFHFKAAPNSPTIRLPKLSRRVSAGTCGRLP